MKSLIRKHTVLAILTASLFPLALTVAARPVTVTVKARQPGAEIPPDFLGLSYETSSLLPDTNGVHYFRPGNKPLIAIFKTIGVRSLRIGGNSVDATNVPMPSLQDVKTFFQFARAAGVRVIFSVRLEESQEHRALPASSPASNAQYAAQIAKLVHDHYADVLDNFAIGNEPYYYPDYAVYSRKWKAIHDAILAEDPEATFSGPDLDANKQMVREFGNASGRLVELTLHNYPFGCAYKNYKAARTKEDTSLLVPHDAAKARDQMLSPAAYQDYQDLYEKIAHAIAGTSVTYRLTEVNSFWFSGLKGASDRYASALWGADYLYWWADHGADGLNFHTGDRTGGTLSMPCRYAAFVTSAHGYKARPLAYGMKLFDLGGYGKVLVAKVDSTTNQNLAAYAMLSEGKTVCVTLINKTHGPKAKEETIHITLDMPLANSKAQVIFLRARNNNLGDGSSGVTLGGAPIKEDGTWNGRWNQLPPSVRSHHLITVTMPPASAAVVKAAIH